MASRRSNEPIVDFVYISSGGGSGGGGGPTSIFLGQVTFNPNHSSDGDKTVLLLQKILTKACRMDVPRAIAAVKTKQLRLVYAIVGYASAHLMTARKLQSEVQSKREGAAQCTAIESRAVGADSTREFFAGGWLGKPPACARNQPERQWRRFEGI